LGRLRGIAARTNFRTPTVAAVAERSNAAAAFRFPVVSELPSVVTILVAGAFAFRSGTPGFRHDWLWPSDRHVLIRWFIEYGLSVWNPHGLGSAGQLATFNLVFAYFAGLAATGLPARAVLFIAFSSLFLGAVFGVAKLFDELNVRNDRTVVRILGSIYALSPILFQKTVAGQLFWLAAYAALPWFTAFVWRGCSEKPHALRSFTIAALLYAFSSTQIQFLAFDAFVAFAIVVAHARNAKAWLGLAVVLTVGLIHNANAVLAPFASPGNFNIATYHATRDWEVDMSAPFFDLFLLGGYGGYDRAALPPILLALYQVGKYALVLLAIGGVLQRSRRGPWIFFAIALAALLFASGWHGPLAPLFDLALQRYVYFTIFRELYHVMALYALAIVVLAGYACSRLPRRFALLALLLPSLVVLPFISGGLDRLVPAVLPVAGETETAYAIPHLRVPLPAQEPLSKPGLSWGGNDPARLDDDVPTNGNAPLFIQWILDPRLPAFEQRSVLADLGVASVAWREQRVSVLAEAFEPGVGATFEGFERRQADLRTRFASRAVLQAARATVMLERSINGDPLQYILADAGSPSGRDVGFLSSFIGNDIRKQWVSSRVWAWFAPQLTNVSSDTVFTLSGAPLSLSLAAATNETLYVLAAGRNCRLDGRPGTLVPRSRNGEYAWWRWHINRPTTTASLQVDGLASVASVRVSGDASWHPSPVRRRIPTRSRPVDASQTWPWSLSGNLPPMTDRETLVFGRTFTRDWHLHVQGSDLGPASKVDGIFNGWTIAPATTARSFTLIFFPQIGAGIVIAVSTLLEAVLLGIAVWPKLRRLAR